MGRVRPHRGNLPTELGFLIDMLEDFEQRIDTLETPDGAQRNDTVGRVVATLAYLASLQTYAASPAASVSTGTVPNDAQIYWFATTPDTGLTIDIPTGKATVEASVGEASLTPGGNFVVGYVSYSVRDANGINIPGHALGNNTGRLYTNQRLGLSVSTGPNSVVIPDPVAYPGPYLIRAFVGMWAATANTTPVSGVFNNPTLRVSVIGDGVPS